jgi:hypothetical protein
MDTLSPGDVPAPELTPQQREFVRALRAGELHGQIAATAYELGCAETEARMFPRPAAKRRHLEAVPS